MWHSQEQTKKSRCQKTNLPYPKFGSKTNKSSFTF